MPEFFIPVTLPLPAAHKQQQYWKKGNFMQTVFLDGRALFCALEDCAIKNYTCRSEHRKQAAFVGLWHRQGIASFLVGGVKFKSEDHIRSPWS